MEQVSKITGISRNMFSVLATAYGLDRIACFEKEEKVIPIERQKREYFNTLFKMCQENMIAIKENHLEPIGEIRDCFEIMKESRKIVTIQGRNSAGTNLCLYIEKNGNIVILRAGNRKNEFLKFEKQGKTELWQLLSDSGHLPESLLKEMQEEERENETQDMYSFSFLHQLQVKDSNEWFNIPQIESVIAVYDVKTDREEGILGIIYESLRDKLILKNSGKITITDYSPNEVMRSIENLLEEGKDDIS